MRKTSKTLLLLLPVILLFQACPKSTNVEVSKSVKAAQSLAIAPVALRAASDIFSELDAADVVSEPLAQVIYKGTEDAQNVLDAAQADIEAGKFDAKKTSALLKNLSVSINTQIQKSSLGISEPKIVAQVREWSSLITFAIDQSISVLDALKPPVVPVTPIIDVQSKQQQSAVQFDVAVWSPDVLTRVIAISTRSAIELAQVKQQTDVAVLWALAKEKSANLHSANKERIK